MTKKKTVKRVVEVTLTKADLADRGKELAKQSKHLANLTVKKKRVMDVFKNKMDNTSNHIIRLTDVIDKGFETKEIDCVEIRDFQRKVKFYYDAEGTLVDQVPFTEHDMQTEIDDYLDQVFSPPSDDEIEQLKAEMEAREQRKRELEEEQEKEYEELADLADKTSEQLDNLTDAEANHGSMDAEQPDQQGDEPDSEEKEDKGF